MSESTPPPVLVRAAQRYVAFCGKHPLAVIAVAIVLAGLCGALALRIEINDKLGAMMPKHTPTQRALAELEARAPLGATPYYLLVQSTDSALNQELADKLLKGALAWPEAKSGMRKRDPGYFLDRRLLYLPASETEELAEEVAELVRWERCEKLPGCVNLDDERPPQPDLEGLRRRYETNPETRALLSLFGMSKLDPDEASKPPGADEEGATPPKDAGSLCSPDGHICAVQIVLDQSPNDIDYAERMVKKGEELIRSIRPPGAPDDLIVAVSGAYRNTPKTKQSVVEDLQRTSALSALLVLLLVMIQFRGVRALFLLVLPIVVGIVWTLGVIALIHPRLNLITSFMLAVLAGIGIDFGVHLLTHYGAERERALSPADALSSTLHRLGPSMLVAATTTGFGFAALMAAKFRGFAEMGGLAAIGVGLSLLAFVILLPPCVLILQRLKPETRSVVRKLRLPKSGPTGRHALLIVVSGIALSAILGFIGRDISFEHNFRNLRPPGVSNGISWSSTLHGTERNAIYLLADDAAVLERATSTIRTEGPQGLTRTDAAWVFTPQSFIPPDQPARLEAIASLRAAIEDGRRHASDKLKEKLKNFDRFAAVTSPITPKDLPVWVKDWLVERDGSFGKLAVVYTDLSGSDALKMQFVSERIDEWRHRFKGVRFASPVAQLGEVIPGLKADAPVIVGLALLGLALGTLLAGRSFRRMLLVLSPIALSMTWALGALVLLGMKVNMYNMLIFPLSFGIGVDGSIYIVWAMRRAKGAPIPWAKTWRSARAVVGSTLTTIAGFGSLSISQNPGLASLGHLAILTLSLTLIANLFWLPALLGWLSKADLTPNGVLPQT